MRVDVLGELVVEVAGREVGAPASRRAWEVLAWLAVHPGPQPRSRLAATLWPHVLDESARASLRSALWAMRRALGPDGAGAVVADRDRVALRCETDLERFDDLVGAGDLAAAVALCRGPLLADLDADWVFEARDAHAARLHDVLARLAAGAATPEEAVAWARRRVASDPLDEEAARDLMRRLADAGRRADALATYDRLCGRLRGVFGLTAEPATRALAAAIRDADGRRPLATHAHLVDPLLGDLRSLADDDGRGAVVSWRAGGTRFESRVGPTVVDGVDGTRVDVHVEMAGGGDRACDARRLALAAALAALEQVASTGAPRARG